MTAAHAGVDDFDFLRLDILVFLTNYIELRLYFGFLLGLGGNQGDAVRISKFDPSRFEAFPVDTWIRKAMDSMYSTGENPKKIRSFAAARFGGGAGFAQQLIFAAIRNGHI